MTSDEKYFSVYKKHYSLFDNDATTYLEKKVWNVGRNCKIEKQCV